MTEWISVKTSVPPNNRPILALLEFDDIRLVAEGTYNEKLAGNWFFPGCNLSWERPCEVKFWMERPELPK